MKIVVDTSVWVSIALSVVRGRRDSAAFRLFELFQQPSFHIAASNRGMLELGDILSDPDLGLDARFALEFFEIVDDLTEVVEIFGLDMGCRDDADDHVVEAAYNFRADALVTRDRDLAAFPVDEILAERGCRNNGSPALNARTLT